MKTILFYILLFICFKTYSSNATFIFIRCIIFLAKGNLTDLHKYIETATFDTRDVMLWAEYEKLNDDFNFKRLRDFNNTFEECTNDVKE